MFDGRSKFDLWYATHQGPQHIHYPLSLTHLGAITLFGSAHLTCLLDFRDGYYVRSGIAAAKLISEFPIFALQLTDNV
jgi:hypothetical protein